MIDWWGVGTRWRDKLTNVEHGDVLRVTADFAKHEAIAGGSITPNTLRGYRAAAELVERLHRDGLVDDAGKRALTKVRIKVIAALQRTSRYGDAALRGMLDEVLAAPLMSIPDLLVREAAARSEARGRVSLEANSHTYRLRSRSFRSGALQAIAAEGGGLKPVRPPSRFEPFVIDAVRKSGGGHGGVRLVAETAGTTVRPRLAEAFLQAVAAARAFEAVVLLTEASADADDLAARIARLGPCGVGASWFNGGKGSIEVRRKPERGGKPDLAARYADRFASFLAPPAEPGTGDAG